MGSFPLIGLCGTAGSGKDSAANFFVQNHKATTISLADPIKRFAKHVFGFTDEQLWGPSELRNAPDARYFDWKSSHYNANAYYEAERTLDYYSTGWLRMILPGDSDFQEARDALWRWHSVLERYHQDNDLVLTPRYVLQSLGTEFARNFSKNVWIDFARGIAIQLLGGDFIYDRTEGLIRKPGSQPELIVITNYRNKEPGWNGSQNYQHKFIRLEPSRSGSWNSGTCV
jgi:hypothetical protein